MLVKTYVYRNAHRRVRIPAYWLSTDVCTDVHTDVCIDYRHVSRRAYRRAHRHVYRHVRHVYRHVHGRGTRTLNSDIRAATRRAARSVSAIETVPSARSTFFESVCFFLAAVKPRSIPTAIADEGGGGGGDLLYGRITFVI